MKKVPRLKIMVHLMVRSLPYKPFVNFQDNLQLHLVFFPFVFGWILFLLSLILFVVFHHSFFWIDFFDTQNKATENIKLKFPNNLLVGHALFFLLSTASKKRFSSWCITLNEQRFRFFFALELQKPFKVT